MTPFTSLVGYIVLFTVVAVIFLFSTLLIGMLVRPNKPNPEKKAIYECGEPTIGSSWVQFDLRFYVVALLFVIFDVEVAFFFPWAAVFGKTTRIADPSAAPTAVDASLKDLGLAAAADATSTHGSARQLGWIAFVDLLVFFGVVLVGFAYLWRRGDLDWVRSTAAERAIEAPPTWSEAPVPAEPAAPRETAAV